MRHTSCLLNPCLLPAQPLPLACLTLVSYLPLSLACLTRLVYPFPFTTMLAGTINLTDMKDVRYDPKSQNRFELETYERTFVFK